MNQPILRHICKVEYCAAYHLKRAIILPAQAKALVGEPMPWQELPLVGLASLEVSDEVEDGVRIYTSKLNATLCKSFLHPKRPSAFRLTDVQGNQYLLGTAYKPFPLVAIITNTSTNEAERTVTVLSANWVSLKPLLTIS